MHTGSFQPARARKYTSAPHHILISRDVDRETAACGCSAARGDWEAAFASFTEAAAAAAVAEQVWEGAVEKLTAALPGEGADVELTGELKSALESAESMKAARDAAREAAEGHLTEGEAFVASRVVVALGLDTQSDDLKGRLHAALETARTGLAAEQAKWAALRMQFKKGTHVRTTDGAVGVVLKDADADADGLFKNVVELRLTTEGSVKSGVSLEVVTQLTAAEIAELDSEEAKLDHAFLERERANTVTVEAWTGMTKKSATYLIQSYARGWAARRSLEKRAVAVVVIQRVTRGWLCRLQLAAAVRREAAREGAATTIQAAARGLFVRKLCFFHHLKRENVYPKNKNNDESCIKTTQKR